MAKKKPELADKRSFFERHRIIFKYTFPIILASLFLFGIWKISTLNSIQKDNTYNYVCQIVAADPELGMMAMKCMVK